VPLLRLSNCPIGEDQKMKLPYILACYPHFFYLECGLYFACSWYVQHTQRDKVFAWAITEFQSSSQTANAIRQWAKVGAISRSRALSCAYRWTSNIS